MTKKTILCFGDSNVWGSIASPSVRGEPSGRYDENTRWTAVLQNSLRDTCHVVEEGLCGRATIYQTAEEPYKNGEPYLLPCLLSHRPLDLVIIMLGSNDVKKAFGLTEDRLGIGMERLVDIVQSCAECGAGNIPPKVLILAPIPIRTPTGRTDYFMARDGEAGIALTKRFAPIFEKIAAEKGCFFFDAAAVGEADLADGLHLTRESHIALGKALAEKVKGILKV